PKEKGPWWAPSFAPRRGASTYGRASQRRSYIYLGGVDCLDGQADAALAVHFEDLHTHRVTLGELVGNLLHTLLGDLRDVHQSVLARQDGDECTKVHELGDLALVDTTDFDIGGNQL